MPQVRFYFDFISPFSWLALTRAPELGSRLNIIWDLRPVVYSRLLDAHDLLGPGEVPAKRRTVFADAVRSAQRLGKTLVGPPVHPFRSIDALRVAWLYRDDPAALSLCVALAEAAWSGGRDLADATVLAGVVDGCGLDASDLPGRVARSGVKERLRQETEQAVAAGVFGVPTFVHGRDVLWGQDRMDHLEEILTGKLATREDLVDDLLRRPRGIDRPGVRQRFTGKS